ncbi:MAG TPA: UPF0262 family protein [Rhodospirillales bacterium]|nr:UPF0262 family protein [Rhodospirillales bacterium]
MDAPPREAGPRDPSQRISRIMFEETGRIRLSARIENERRAALFDLIEENHFAPAGVAPGPYVVRLGISGDCLVFRIFDEADRLLTRFTLALGSLKRIIKDYFLICDSYFNAIKTLPPSRIEAIDMARRGLHNEGAEVLRERLTGKVEIDLPTARRLFTLICVLHIRA